VDAIAGGFAGLDSKAAEILTKNTVGSQPSAASLDKTYTQRSQSVEYDAARGELTLPDFAETKSVNQHYPSNQAMKLALDRASWR
jgi:anti-sigma-K factor RskA